MPQPSRLQIHENMSDGDRRLLRRALDVQFAKPTCNRYFNNRRILTQSIRLKDPNSDEIIKQIILNYDIIRRPSRDPDKPPRYEVLGKHIGEGSFGRVYASRFYIKPTADNSLEIRPSQKIVKEIYLNRRDAKRFAFYDIELPNNKKENEIAKMALNNKSHISEHGDYTYLTQQRVYGNCLSRHRLEKLSYSERIAVAYAMVCNLQHLQNLDIVHGDVKCNNFIASLQGGMFVDFGCSELAKPGMLKFFGTQGYIAPERRFKHVVSSKDSHKRTDNYSLGITLQDLFFASFSFTAKFIAYSANSGLHYIYPRIPNNLLFSEERYNEITTLKTVIHGLTNVRNNERMELDEAERLLRPIHAKYLTKDYRALIQTIEASVTDFEKYLQPLEATDHPEHESKISKVKEIINELNCIKAEVQNDLDTDAITRAQYDRLYTRILSVYSDEVLKSLANHLMDAKEYLNNLTRPLSKLLQNLSNSHTLTITGLFKTRSANLLLKHKRKAASLSNLPIPRRPRLKT